MNSFRVLKTIYDEYSFEIAVKDSFRDSVQEEVVKNMNLNVYSRLIRELAKDPKGIYDVDMDDLCGKLMEEEIMNCLLSYPDYKRDMFDICDEWNWDYDSDQEIEDTMKIGVDAVLDRARILSNHDNGFSIDLGGFRKINNKNYEGITGKNKPARVVFGFDGESPDHKG